MGDSDNEGASSAKASFSAINRKSMATDAEGSTRGNNAPSREASVALAASEKLDSGRATSKSSLSRLASPNPSTTGRTPIPDESARSASATRRGSTSSQVSSKQQPVASYGTRSRNRPRASRPNYAEDNVDMDFEMQQPQENAARYREESNSTGDDSEPVAPPSEPVAEKVAAKPRKTAATNGWNALNNTKNDTPVASSSASMTVGGSTLPRKRKAAAVATQNIAAGSQPAPPAPAVNGKKNGANAAKNAAERETNLVSFEKCNTMLNKDGNLVSDDGVVFSPNDHVYLVCEPPGEPYYLGRIMEFRTKVPDDPKTQVEYLRINWAYRPRDIQRFVNDSRLVYVTMHSDLCPLTSLRGKCQIKHRTEIDDLDEYRKIPNAFWFNQCFDRFIHRWYEVIPTSQVVNVPQKIKRALDERWKYIVVEASRVKELTSAVKTCTRCSQYCANDDSVDCALCKKTYHLQCVRPPLLKKPSRGFAWACGPCSRAAERKLEARRTPIVGEAGTDAEEEEVIEEEEEPQADDTPADSPSDVKVENVAPEAEIAHAKMWPMRYLGIHCRVEDVLQYEDRAIYPRASSRLGPKHQANISEWYGRPVQLVKPVEIKRKYIKAGAGKKDTKLTKETQAAIEADRAEKAKRPKYVEDEPVGYVARGEDFANDDPRNTAQTVFKLPQVGEQSSRGNDDSATLPSEEVTDAYMAKAKKIAVQIGVEAHTTDFLDRAIYLLQHNAFNPDAALAQLKKSKAVGDWSNKRWGYAVRKDFREPKLTLKDDEKKRFAEGVRRYGSELRFVRQYVRTISHADTVRYWYYWKKTPQGRKIWGAYDGRKNASKKKAATVEASTKLLDDVADKNDDSAFDNQKVYNLARRMQCKYCNTRHSRYWRRAPNTNPGETVLGDQRSKDKNTQFMVALCQRCARLWRKYAIKWEDQDETQKKITAGGGRGWKRRVDEELVKEWAIAEQTAHLPPIEPEDMPGVVPVVTNGEPPRKKAKGPEGAVAPPAVVEKKKPQAPPPPPPPPKEPTPPPVPSPPKMRVFPCAVCDAYEAPGDPMLQCRDCRLMVHKGCYGVAECKNPIKWSCDPCTNDRREIANSSSDPADYRYECVLCPIKITPTSMVEPPRISHKKKTDRDRERERMEKELADKLAAEYRQHQLEKGRPVVPREALKRTADNKWVHVTCALWTPEIRFSNAKTLEVAEGIPLIPRARREQVCKFCKTNNGACVSCHYCHSSFHVACAYRHNYIFGFDVMPVKSSRRDGVNIVKLGDETGTLTAGIWCKDHSSSLIKGIIHYLNEVVDETGRIALQLFAENYKQADLTLTGTARKANYLDEITSKSSAMPQVNGTNRRVSTTGTAGGTRSGRNSTAGLVKDPEPQDGDVSMTDADVEEIARRCDVCDIDVSPRWYKREVKEPAAPAVSAPAAHEMGFNGTRHDPTSSSDESRMDVDGPHLSNGHGPAVAGRPLLNGLSSESNGAPAVASPVVIEKWDCNKCHWKRKNKPEELEKKVPEPEPKPQPVAEPVRSPPRHPIDQFQHPPPGPIMQPGHSAWPPPYANGLVRSPPHGMHPPHNGFHPHGGPPPQAGPGHYGLGHPPPIHHQPSFPPPGHAMGAPPPGHAAPPGPAPLHVIQANVPNGLPSPHGPPPMRSPTHPPPNGPAMHHQRESPFNGGPPPVPGTTPYPPPHPYSHHGSPQPPPSTMPAQVGAPRPTTPRDAPPTTPRLPHGASASPNVRNILND